MSTDTPDDDLSVFPEHDDAGRAAAARVLDDAGLDGPVAVNEVDTSSEAVERLERLLDPAEGLLPRADGLWAVATLRALAAERDDLLEKCAVANGIGFAARQLMDAVIARAEAAEAERDALVRVADAARAYGKSKANNPSVDLLNAMWDALDALDALPPGPGQPSTKES